MAADPRDASRHAGQVVRRVLLRRNVAIDAETAQLVADAVQAGAPSRPPRRRPRGPAAGSEPRRRAVRASSRSWPTQTRCRCTGLPSRYDLRFAGLRLVRRCQGVGWLVGGRPAGEEPEGVVGG